MRTTARAVTVFSHYVVGESLRAHRHFARFMSPDRYLRVVYGVCSERNCYFGHVHPSRRSDGFGPAAFYFIYFFFFGGGIFKNYKIQKYLIFFNIFTTYLNVL